MFADLLMQGPEVYIPVILISIIATILGYGAFPFIFARTRKKAITKKKYYHLCFGVNFLVMILIKLFSDSTSAGPYVLWTWIFTHNGMKYLEGRAKRLYPANNAKESVPAECTPAVHNTPVMPRVDETPRSDDSTPDDALRSILKFHANETIRVMEANAQSQPNNENDADFGLVPEKPIFTLALMSVDGEKEYLNQLYTAKGEKITYTRQGSTGVDGINGMIDIYDTYLPSGDFYKTIYINMYGAKRSQSAPKGFSFSVSATATKKVCPKCNHEVRLDSVYCHFCGSKIDAKISTPAKVTAVESRLEDTPIAPVPPTGNANTGKQVFCKNCGSVVDSKTKKCTGCGKQYFKLSSKSIPYVIIGVLVVIIICLIVGKFASPSQKPSASDSSVYSSSSENETYTVTLDRQKGAGGSSHVSVKQGEAMPNAVAPTRSGYIFKGYYSGTNGTGTKYYNADMSSEQNWVNASDGTLYAYWEEAIDTQFTSSSDLGDSVYADIVSIFPEIGIYEEGSSDYSEFVCRCVTSTGSTVWVHMARWEYLIYFDSDASTSVFDSSAEEITFSSAIRIHGIVKWSEHVLSGLGSDIGAVHVISLESVDGFHIETAVPTINVGVLTVGVSADYYPYEYIDDSGNIVGIEIEIAREIANRLDLQVEFVNIEFSDLLATLADGQVDCIFSMMEHTPERSQVACASLPLFTEDSGDGYAFMPVAYITETNSDLQSAINGAILEMQNDGTMAAIVGY